MSIEQPIQPHRSARTLDVLRTYYHDLSLRPVLEPGEEFEMAGRIERSEVALWASLLGYPAFARSLLSMVASRLEGVATDRVERLIRRGRGEQARRRLTEACGELARELRQADPDHALLDQVLGRIDAVARGETRRLYGRALRIKPESATFRHFLAEVRRQHREVLEARRVFIEANLRLVMTLVRRYSRYCTPQIALQDLVQEGNIGLIRAVGRFDPHRGFRFSTYASWWIRHGITRALADKGRMIRLPVYKVTTHHKVNQSSRRLEQALGRAPTADEIGADINLEPEEVQDSLQTVSSARLLVSSLQPDGESVLELIPDPRSLDENRRLVDRELFDEQVRPLLGGLGPMERDILDHRFGLDGTPTQTLNEIGERYQLSRERIRQIQQEVLERLRTRLEERRAS